MVCVFTAYKINLNKSVVSILPNVKSAEKRVKVIEAKTLKNQMIKTNLKTVLKKYEAVVTSGNKDEIVPAYNLAIKKLDQAVSAGILHKNTAAHKKSQLTLKKNKVIA